MKKHADKNKRSQEFNVGDKVMVKLLPQDPSCKRHQEYLVKWQGYKEEENTWERAADLSYNDKIEAYHMQKLTRASTALVGDNVTGCLLAPTMTSTVPLCPSSTALLCPSSTAPHAQLQCPLKI
ncbi:hypothetical protein RJ639_017293 [Escallonia herrerae]|uniref:Chromo domain-containing protein n=1 Tax=Escallonia herrerae TaxID=1293975 RepID=A0AA89AM76_9ASTE|nr:hypothetical protein RJ639_017293 [Escallonia herrerae]